MTMRGFVAILSLTAAATFFAGCGGNDCGTGTAEEDGECVVSAAINCGPGTQLSGGECVPASAACAGNTALDDNGQCVVVDGACQAPATLDTETGRCIAPEQITCGVGTRLVGDQCLPDCPQPFEILNPDGDACVPAARVQVVHASPDPALSTVDVYDGLKLLQDDAGNVIGDDFAFGDITAVIKVPAGGFGIAPSDSTSVDEVSAPASTPLMGGERYLIVIRGEMGSGAGQEVAVFSGFAEQSTDPDAEDVQLALVNAGIGAPAISVGRQVDYATAPSEELFSGVGYGGATGALSYEDVDEGTNAIDFYDAAAAPGGALPFASLQTSVEGTALVNVGESERSSGVLVITGLRAAAPDPGFEVIAALPDGTGGFLDEAARLQIVHASIEAGTGVDVYLSDVGAEAPQQLIANNVPYQGAMPFRSFAAGTPKVVQLVPENVTNPDADSVVASSEFSPGFGQTARLVAVGDPGDDSLTVNVVNGAEQAADPGTVVMPMIDIQMYHASTNAPASVDVYFSPLAGKNIDGTPDVSALAFASETQAVARDFSGYVVSLTMPGVEAGGQSLTDFNANIAENAFFPDSAGESLFFAVTGDAIASAQDLDLLVVSPTGRAEFFMGGSL